MKALARFSFVAGATLLAAVVASQNSSAQTPGAPGQGAEALRLTVEDAVRLAVEHNPDLAVDRLDPQISDTQVAQANSAFAPTFSSTFQRNNQLAPPASFLVGAQGTRTDTFTSNVGVAQRLPWAGGTYSVGWDSSRIDSDSFLQNFNPTLRSGLQLLFSQPLLRDRMIDNARQQLTLSRRNRDIADTRFYESTVRKLAEVKRAYWDLVSANAAVGVQQRSLDLAQELTRVNQARVDVGQAPPIDLLSARAEVAQREEALIVAQTTARQTEDWLRTLILDPDRSDLWNVQIEPVDQPPLGLPLPNLDAAVRAALGQRADLQRARKETENAGTAVSYYTNQRMLDVRLQASYLTTGLGGTHLDRVGGFPGVLVGTGEVTGFGQVLNQVLRRDFATWAVGVSLSYPIGRSAEDATLARARLEEQQASTRVKSLELNIVRQVRQAAWQVEMNAKRIDTTRAARELAEQRLDAEQKRFEVGISTSFLVIQAQRDLAQARNNELSATLAYDLSIIDFEAIQQAGPAQGGSSGSSGGTLAGAPGAPVQPARPAADGQNQTAGTPR